MQVHPLINYINKPKKPKNISITIGCSLVKSRSIKDAENIINDFKSITLFSKVEQAADKISAAVIGLKKVKICSEISLDLYFSMNLVTMLMNINGPHTMPRVAETAPQNPKYLKPMKVAAFMAIGPGVT